MTSDDGRLRIDVWSDVVCPWCAIGKAHLERALEGFDHRDRVDVVWRSFELDPGAPTTREGSYDALLARKYGTGEAGGRAMVTRLATAAERAGVEARFDLVRPTSTFDAHRLLHLAREHGRQGELKSRLVHAYLAEGALVSDPEVLERLAVEAGLDADDVRRTLGSQEHAHAVRADEAEAARREVTAVPTFLVDGRVVIPGAQSPESMLATLRRAWSRRPA